MKNLTSTMDLEKIRSLCYSEKELHRHIQNVLTNRKPRSYIYSQAKSSPAAVLIPLFFKNNQAHLLFTLRTDTVEHHKGQISFPGGKRDDSDGHLQETALRETEEEVGISQNDVKVLGQTDRFLTNTNFLVTPYVGVFDYPYSFETSKAEIERLIKVPLVDLLDETIFEVKELRRNGYTWLIHYYQYAGDVIWGVTGFLLSNFLSIVFGMDRNLFKQPAK